MGQQTSARHARVKDGMFVHKVGKKREERAMFTLYIQASCLLVQGMKRRRAPIASLSLHPFCFVHSRVSQHMLIPATHACYTRISGLTCPAPLHQPTPTPTTRPTFTPICPSLSPHDLPPPTCFRPPPQCITWVVEISSAWPPTTQDSAFRSRSEEIGGGGECAQHALRCCCAVHCGSRIRQMYMKPPAHNPRPPVCLLSLACNRHSTLASSAQRSSLPSAG